VTNVVSLKAGQVQIISPAGWYAVKTGRYTTVQQYDPITGIWRLIGGGSTLGSVEYFYSDGVNYRLANQNGCAVGAVITNVGAGYTSAPTVTASAGGSIWKAIIGGAVSQTVNIVNGGSNYTYPPVVQISTPPAGGVQATGYCALTTGAVSSVTIVDQGAGYTYAPTITFINDPREGLNGTTVGYGASAQATLTGSGEISAILCLDHGNPIAFTPGSATSIPTLTISPQLSSAAATVAMNWSITGLQSASYSNGTSGLTGVLAAVFGIDQFATANSTILNPTIQKGIVKGRMATISIPIGSGILGAYTTAVVDDGGVYEGTPLLVIANDQITTPGGATGALATMGYLASDTSYLTQI
jgi:hypothetical protein